MILRRFTIFLLLLLTAIIVVNSTCLAEIKGERARQIEAAFLLRFSQYVKWPEPAFDTADSPIIVGILGRDPFGSVLDKLARSAKANGRGIEVRRFDDPDSIKRCHILYITKEETEDMENILLALEGQSVLLIGHSENFLQFGMVNFVMVKNKIRFNINQANSKKAGLKISSKLLKVAHKVEG